MSSEFDDPNQAASTPTATEAGTTLAAPTEPASAPLPFEGECVIDYSETDPREISCMPSCNAAFVFASAATNPAMSDVFGYRTAFVRMTLADGSEPTPDSPVTMADSVVEVAGVYGAPQDGFHYFQTTWSATGDPVTSDVLYSTWYLDEVELGVDQVADIPLRQTAQFIDTAVGCVPNPFRAEDAGTRQGPGAPAVPHEAPPDEGPTVTDDEVAAAELFVELVEQACTNTDAPPDPRSAYAVSRDDGTFLVTDGNGTQLRLDAETRTVSSLDGPEGPVPQNYAFCDSAVFEGTYDG